ncbi:hypothetical protein HYU09_05505 [Candidatus Woesearchaeota archaeon]|nr:hypothetical protein [Candidatus Woesearchaeota archaeon]
MGPEPKPRPESGLFDTSSMPNTYLFFCNLPNVTPRVGFFRPFDGGGDYFALHPSIDLLIKDMKEALREFDEVPFNPTGGVPDTELLPEGMNPNLFSPLSDYQVNQVVQALKG